MSVVGEITTLAKNSPKYASLKSTVPMSVVKQWKLKAGDQLEWEFTVIEGKMTLLVRRVLDGA